MKIVLVGIFVSFFVVLPMYLLNTFVMPDLQSMGHSYDNQTETVEALFPASQAPTK